MCFSGGMSLHAVLNSHSSVYSALITVLEFKKSNHEIHPACLSPSTQKLTFESKNESSHKYFQQLDRPWQQQFFPSKLSDSRGDVPAPSEDVSLGLETDLLFALWSLPPKPWHFTEGKYISTCRLPSINDPVVVVASFLSVTGCHVRTYRSVSLCQVRFSHPGE